MPAVAQSLKVRQRKKSAKRAAAFCKEAIKPGFFARFSARNHVETSTTFNSVDIKLSGPMVKPRSGGLGWAQRAPQGAGNQGFTLIELLVVIVIVGMLAAIALPSFLGQAAKAKQAGALKAIGVVNRAQQTFFLENDRFARSTDELGFPTSQFPADYVYTVSSSNQGVHATRTTAIPTDPSLRGYAGVVFTTVDPNGVARLAVEICEGSTTSIPAPTLVNLGGQTQLTNCNDL
jgi:prepilin-type N-terminal cleavage/methylation domain-containing protein